MDKFVSGALSVTVHGCVTYSVVGKNKATALDDGNEDIAIERENLRLSPDSYITRLKITNNSVTMMKLISAYPFISDDMKIGDIKSPEWMVFNGTRQLNDIPCICTLGVRDEAFYKAVNRLSEEGIMLKNCSDGDAVISGDLITIIKAGKTYTAIEILAEENQLTDISLSIDRNGDLKAVRAGGDYNCLLEAGDIKMTDWVRISEGGNYLRLIDDYTAHNEGVYADRIHSGKQALVYALTENMTYENLCDKLSLAAHMKTPFDYFLIGNGWQKAYGDWEGNENFSDNMRRESERIENFGFKAGIWTAPFIVDKNSQFFEEEKELLLHHADGSVCLAEVDGKECAVLDVSSPQALEWLDMMYQRISAFGYYFHDVDYTNVFILQKDVILANPTITATEAYLNALRTIREAIGESGYLHISNGFNSPLVGIADSVQVCSNVHSEGNSNRKERLPELANQISLRGFMNKWWYNSCGKLLNGSMAKINFAELKTVLVCEYMSAGTTLAADLSTNEELCLLKYVYPRVKSDIYCRDVFSGNVYVSAVDVEVNGDYHTVCFMNWSDEEVELIFRLDNKTCGGYVDHASKYDVSSFFGRNRVRHAKYDDVIRLGKIAPGSSEVVKIIKSDKPHIMLSDMNLSMGGEAKIVCDGAKVRVSGENHFNCKGNYLVALPEGMVCIDGKDEFSFTVNGQGSFVYEKEIKILPSA